MQSLGLQGESKRSDGRLKSIFWPAVDNAWDVDYLGQQGFWICFFIGISQFVFSLLTRNPLLIVIAALTALIYLVGGMGVRERSWPAAAMVFACYLIDTLYAIATGILFTPGGVIKVVFLGLLLSNVRATFIASEWRLAGEDEDRPTRFSETLRDKLVDAWPPKLWPPLQIPFYTLSGLWLLVSGIGVGILALARLGVLPTNPTH